MLMMNELIDTLHTEQCSLVLLHEGNVHKFNGRGARTLYNLLTEAPEALLNSKLAAKAAGRTAAKMMVNGGVCEVYAEENGRNYGLTAMSVAGRSRSCCASCYG